MRSLDLIHEFSLSLQLAGFEFPQTPRDQEPQADWVAQYYAQEVSPRNAGHPRCEAGCQQGHPRQRGAGGAGQPPLDQGGFATVSAAQKALGCVEAGSPLSKLRRVWAVCTRCLRTRSFNSHRGQSQFIKTTIFVQLWKSYSYTRNQRIQQLSPFEIDVLGPLFRDIGGKVKHKLEVRVDCR